MIKSLIRGTSEQEKVTTRKGFRSPCERLISSVEFMFQVPPYTRALLFLFAHLHELSKQKDSLE